jgi:hypothetical protein
MGGSTQLMHRIRNAVLAFAALGVAVGLTVGLAAAHVMPAASDGGIQAAREASGKQVPMGRDTPATQNTTNTDTPDTAGAPPEGTHGADVSAAAQAPTPEGDWANHGAYVSSIATGWGQATAEAHRSTDASAAATTHAAPAATKGLSHKP